MLNAPVKQPPPVIKFTDTHVHVSGRVETNGGNVKITLHVLAPESVAGKNPHPVSMQQFPGFRSLGKVSVVIDGASSAGIVPGCKFELTPKAPTP
jgi:hypothetical protein